MPRILSATSQSVDLEWTAPESDAGHSISSYVVMSGAPGARRSLCHRQTVKSTATCCTLTKNIFPTRTYEFAVAARNKAGLGEFSEFSSSIIIIGDPGTSILRWLYILCMKLLIVSHAHTVV